MARKLALIIGNSIYEDTNLAQLATPDVDVRALAEVLRDPGIGAFDEVVALVNESATTIRREVAGFFAEKGRDDLLLLYFSGHGIKDANGQLFLAVKDTEHKLPRGTAIPAAFITEEMDNSRSRSKVLILDCCHSGAFARGMKGVPRTSVGTATAFEGTGSGRVVLTATDSTQYAWEGDQVTGQAENSVFTRHLIQGLRTGASDTNADGQITLDELYDYVYDQVVHETPLQKPGKWSYGQQGEILIARNSRPVVKPAELPPKLIKFMNSTNTSTRLRAVIELASLLRKGPPGLALVALEALKRMAEDDSRLVQSEAADKLEAYEETQRAEQERLALEKAEAERKAKEEEERLAIQLAEQERLVLEKAEAERKAKEEEERLARERAEQDRLDREKAEAERKAIEEEERLPSQRAEQERLGREKADAERQAQEEEKRLARERAEQERQSREKTEIERKAKEEQEQLAREVAMPERKAQETAGAQALEVRTPTARVPRWAIILGLLLAGGLIAGLINPGGILSLTDGRIAFVSNRDGNDEIYVMNADGSGQTRLTNDAASDGDPAWSPDGTRIAFTSNRDSNWEIYVMNADGSGQTRLTNNSADDIDPAWSPDGRRIAFGSDRDGNEEIYVMDANGSGQIRLTNNSVNDKKPAWSRKPTWSPDGSRIAFEGKNDIYVMNADGSGLAQLTNNFGGNWYPTWSPDSRRIAFASGRENPLQIYVMNADGSGQTRLVKDVFASSEPAWSPDGNRIAFTTPITTPSRDSKWEIYVVNIHGWGQIQLTNDSGDNVGPVWQPLP